jgi:hypothetical protein
MMSAKMASGVKKKGLGCLLQQRLEKLLDITKSYL